MATPARPKGTGRKRAPAKRAPKKAAAGSRGIVPQEMQLDAHSGEAAETSRRIEAEGGVVLGAYREPLGGNPVIFAALPIGKVEPTPKTTAQPVVPQAKPSPAQPGPRQEQQEKK